MIRYRNLNESIDQDATRMSEDICHTIGNFTAEINAHNLKILLDLINSFLTTEKNLSFLNIHKIENYRGYQQINLFYDFPEDRWNEYAYLVSELAIFVDKAFLKFTGIDVSVDTEIDSYQLCVYVKISVGSAREPVEFIKKH